MPPRRPVENLGASIPFTMISKMPTSSKGHLSALGAFAIAA
jgi:hypothetical protein